jgi:hypothetical protein
VQALRSIDGESPDIADVSVEPSDDAGRVIVQVRMSDDQPPGTYAGVIYDEASEHPCGTLSVRLGSD